MDLSATTLGERRRRVDLGGRNRHRNIGGNDRALLERYHPSSVRDVGGSGVSSAGDRGKAPRHSARMVAPCELRKARLPLREPISTGRGRAVSFTRLSTDRGLRAARPHPGGSGPGDAEDTLPERRAPPSIGRRRSACPPRRSPVFGLPPDNCRPKEGLANRPLAGAAPVYSRPSVSGYGSRAVLWQSLRSRVSVGYALSESLVVASEFFDLDRRRLDRRPPPPSLEDVDESAARAVVPGTLPIGSDEVGEGCGGVDSNVG